MQIWHGITLVHLDRQLFITRFYVDLVGDPVALYTNQSGRSKKPEAAEKT